MGIESFFLNEFIYKINQTRLCSQSAKRAAGRTCQVSFDGGDRRTGELWLVRQVQQVSLKPQMVEPGEPKMLEQRKISVLLGAARNKYSCADRRSPVVRKLGSRPLHGIRQSRAGEGRQSYSPGKLTFREPDSPRPGAPCLVQKKPCRRSNQ